MQHGNSPYHEVFIGTGLESISFHELNPVVGIPNNHRAGIIISRHFFIRAVVKFGINLNSPGIISLCTNVAIMVIFMRS